MSEMKVVKAWLELPVEERDYFGGLALLEKYSGKLHLVTQLRRNNTFTNLDRIHYELCLIAEVNYVPLVEPKPSSNPVPVAGKVEVPKTPLLQGLIDKRAQLFIDRAKVSDILADLDGDALKEATDKVVGIDDETIAITTQIDYVEKHGSLPAPKENLTKDLEGFKAQKKSLGEKISRLKGQLKKSPGNLDKQAEMDKLVAEREQVELQIKAFTTQ